MIKIIADSTCDLSAELIAKYDIDILPLGVILGDRSVHDGDLTEAELFEWADANKSTPTTSAPSLEEVSEIISKYRDREILVFTISSEMSSTYNVFRIAAEEVGCEKIHIVDSASLSTGIGLQILRAADMAAEGKSFEEIVEAAEAVKPRVRASFVIDTLTYLRRGGRCSALTAIAANLLALKPKIVVADGKMDVSKKYRGQTARVVQDYLNDLMPAIKNAEKKRIFVTSTMQGDALAISADIKAQLEKTGLFEEVIETFAGGVISSHCGPNTLGVLFIDAE